MKNSLQGKLWFLNRRVQQQMYSRYLIKQTLGKDQYDLRFMKTIYFYLIFNGIQDNLTISLILFP
jgi:hypothetical protein